MKDIFIATVKEFFKILGLVAVGVTVWSGIMFGIFVILDKLHIWANNTNVIVAILISGIVIMFSALLFNNWYVYRKSMDTVKETKSYNWRCVWCTMVCLVILYYLAFMENRFNRAIELGLMFIFLICGNEVLQTSWYNKKKTLGKDVSTIDVNELPEERLGTVKEEIHDHV